MSDLIERQVAIDAIDIFVKVDEENCTEYDIGYNDGIDFAISSLSVLPSAESDIEKAFRLFVNWAEECDFGYDNIHDLYEEYRDDIRAKGLSYIEGLMYIAKMEVERGAYVFKEQGPSAFAPDQDDDEETEED